MSRVEIIEIWGISGVLDVRGILLPLRQERLVRHDSSGRLGIFRVPGGLFPVPFHVEKDKSGKYHLLKATFSEIIVFIGYQMLPRRVFADNH